MPIPDPAQPVPFGPSGNMPEAWSRAQRSAGTDQPVPSETLRGPSDQPVLPPPRSWYRVVGVLLLAILFPFVWLGTLSTAWRRIAAVAALILLATGGGGIYFWRSIAVEMTPTDQWTDLRALQTEHLIIVIAVLGVAALLQFFSGVLFTRAVRTSRSAAAGLGAAAMFAFLAPLAPTAWITHQIDMSIAKTLVAVQEFADKRDRVRATLAQDASADQWKAALAPLLGELHVSLAKAARWDAPVVPDITSTF